MLDKYNIISTSVSEAVEKIATDEKDYRKCSFMCFTLHHSHNALFPCDYVCTTTAYKEQTNI